MLSRSDPVFAGTGLLAALVLLVAHALLVAREDRHGARAPLVMLGGHVALTFVLHALGRDHRAEALVRISAATLLLLSLGRLVFLLFVNSFWIRRFAQPLPKIFRDVVQAFIYVGVGLLVLRVGGVEPGSLLTTSALLTAVIGLSLQDTLGNLFAGLAIQVQRPFDVGDWIEFDGDTAHAGQVLEINWRATRIRTLGRVEITVPNGALARAPIVNYSTPTAVVRREVTIACPLDVSPEQARTTLLQGLTDVPGVLQEPPPNALLDDYSDRGLSFRVVYFINSFEQRERVASRVREQLWYALARAGTAIPMPQRELTVQRRGPSYASPRTANVELLRQLDFFSSLQNAELDTLAKSCRTLMFGPGEYIVRTGEEDRKMFVIAAGRVRIASRHNLPDQSNTVAHLGPGDFFGEMSLMTGAARSADVIAETEAHVLVLTRDSIAPLLERHPELVERISQVLAVRRARLDELDGSHSKAPAKKADDEAELLQRIRRFFAL